MQTAAAIAQQLNVKTIHVNKTLCEFLRAEFYPKGDPL